MENRINNIVEKLDFLLEGDIPKAYLIYKLSREAYNNGDIHLAEKLKRLNYLLHNSEVPYTAVIGKNTIFAYGGIGVIIHAAAKIGERANIGSGVTIGGSKSGVPVIGDDVYLAAGSKVIGNIRIGNGCIIGTNAVVRSNLDDFQIVAGVPSISIGRVNRENFYKYSDFYWCKGSTEGVQRFLNWYFPNEN